MARIRTIKPEFWQDEKLSPLAPIHRLVFLGLISMADDCGRLLDNVKVIDAFIFPESSETCRGSIAELSARGRIRRGVTSSGQAIIEIVNWKRHQKVEKPNYSAALPEIATEVVAPVEVATIPRRVGEASGKRRRSVGEASPPHTNDLRPTTDEQRAVAAPELPLALDRPATAPAPAPLPARGEINGHAFDVDPDWHQAAHAEWQKRVGLTDYGRFRKALAPAMEPKGGVQAYPVPLLCRAIAWYAAIRKGTREWEFISPEKFAGGLSGHIAVALMDADERSKLLPMRGAA